MKLIKFFITMLVFGLLSNSATAQKAFLKIDGVDGESTADGHKDWINLVSFNQGVSTKAVRSGVSRMQSRAEFGDFMIKKQVDKATPLLMQACASGQVFPELILEVAGPNRQTYYTITMKKIMVTSVSSGGSDCSSDCQPMEEVSFSYDKITWEYNKGSSAGGSVKASWDISGNKKL